MRSAADIDDVGWPDPAAVLERMESTRSCCPSWRTNSRSVWDCVSETAMLTPYKFDVGASRRGRGISVLGELSLSALGERLDFGDHPVEDVQARVPERRVGDVHADLLHQLVRAGR